MLSWRAATGWPSTEARISTAVAVSAIQGARMKTARTGGAVDAGDLAGRPRTSGSGGRTRCARQRVVGQPEVLAVEHDHPRAGAEHRRAARATSSRSGSARPSRAMPSVIVVDSPPGITSPSSPSRSAATRTSRTSAPSSRSSARVRLEVALQREHADQRRGLPAAVGEELLLLELARLERDHRGAEALGGARRRARGPGSGSSPRRSRRRAAAGSSDLKMPEPTNTPSAPSCIISDGVGRGGDAAGAEQHDGQPAGARDLADEVERRLVAPWPRSRARRRRASARRLISLRDLAHVAHGLDDVARAGLALGADHRRALADPAQRLAEVGRAAHERDLEGPLVDVVGLVGRA